VRYGADYYMLDMGERVLSEKHRVLRPSGSLGIKLGMLGAGLFCCLYLYPLRKRWRWLQRFGKTKHWLDFHVLFGITAPLVITVHSSFKLQGLAGVAYWLMMAVMGSGFIGPLGLMIWTDLRRPFLVASLRRQSMTAMETVWTLGGLLPSSDSDLENAIRLVRRESWLLAKMAFLGRAQQVFQLWHVVHRPFSYSFAVLALIHIALVLAMGYY
jgi:hypothetical protein